MKANFFTFERGLHELAYVYHYNLGCPNYCRPNVCVDLFPKNAKVVKDDVYSWLFEQEDLPSIYSKNLIEHLSNPGQFLRFCYRALVPDGRIMIITDNAEFLPYYARFVIARLGVGAHGNNAYVSRFNDSTHKMIFSKLHLSNLLKEVGFARVEVKRVSMGAKLVATGVKI